MREIKDLSARTTLGNDLKKMKGGLNSMGIDLVESSYLKISLGNGVRSLLHDSQLQRKVFDNAISKAKI
jgi:hypothetical protein